MSVNMIDSQTLNLIRLDGGGGGQYTFDDVPTSGSRNPVTSDGIYNSVNTKVDKVQGKELSTNDYTDNDKLLVESAQPKVLETPIVVDGQTETTIEGALAAINNKSVSITVDDHIDKLSENPVQNKVIAEAFEDMSEATVADALADWNAVFGSEFNPTTNVEVPSVTSLDPSDVVYEND